jgi:hypothetical protein
MLSLFSIIIVIIMINKLEQIWKGTVVACFNVLFDYSSGRSHQSTKNTSLILLSHLHVGLHIGLCFSGFSTKILYELLSHVFYMPCQSHLPLYGHSNVFGDECNL